MSSSKRMDIDPAILTKSADAIEQKTAQFKEAYTSIYSAISEMKSDFIGQTATAYQKELEKYKPNFEEAEKKLKDYAAKIKKYAQDAQGVDDSYKK